jgi:predicted amidohydrolase
MTQAPVTLVEHLSVGVIQTTMKPEAWKGGNLPRISVAEDNRAWHEIRRAMKSFADHDEQPKVVLLPELALPRTRIDDFERILCSMNVLGIVGVDYRLNHQTNVARNEGVVLVPRNLWDRHRSKYAARVWFGKQVPAPAEAVSLASCVPPWSFTGDSNVYIFDAGPFGRFGVSICYDFMDIERALLYRGRVHHLIVLAYNQDLKMFESLAVSLSRTVYCNVIVSNTGHYGGSIVVSPHWDAHKRVGYSIGGGELFSSQCIQLPVRALDDAMRSNAPEKTYKHLPPGFSLSL